MKIDFPLIRNTLSEKKNQFVLKVSEFLQIFSNKRAWGLAGVVVIALATFATTTALQHPQTTTQHASGSSPQVYFGVSMLGANSPSGLASFERDAGKAVSIAMWYQNWGAIDGTQNFEPSWMDAIRTHGSIPMVSWASDNGGEVNQPTFSLSNIINGNFDGYLTQWAQDAKAWGHPFFLRFDWEMNGNWYPWSEQGNGNHVGQFVLAWRHVHNIFTNNGATNVTWVWCPNGETPGETPILGLYPGDQYVDWTCMDGYNFGTVNSFSHWQSFTRTFHQTYIDIFGITSKPLMIAETASVEKGGNKANWITDAFSTQLPNYFPGIKAVVWFNYANCDANADCRIESSSASQQAFFSAMQSSYYASNTFTYLNASPIPGTPPDIALPSTPTPSYPTATPIPYPTDIPISIPSNCYSWGNQSIGYAMGFGIHTITPKISLQDAVNTYPCVHILTGSYMLTQPITIPSNHQIYGSGEGQTTLIASNGTTPWPNTNNAEGVLQTVNMNDSNVVIANLTINAANLASYGACCRAMTIEKTQIANARCNGIGVVGYGMIIKDDTIEGNGSNCPVNPPGSGIYVGTYPANGPPTPWAPDIEGNQIINNSGPGINVDSVWFGKIKNNVIAGNGSWAGVSLYGASNWSISENTISQPATNDVQPYHLKCQGGSNGNHSAGLILCEDKDASNDVTVNNIIQNNQIFGWYGILLVGNKAQSPYLVPRFNTLSGNYVFGSTVGCADNFKHGQWLDGDNIWTNNNCAGSPNTPPSNF